LLTLLGGKRGTISTSELDVSYSLVSLSELSGSPDIKSLYRKDMRKGMLLIVFISNFPRLIAVQGLLFLVNLNKGWLASNFQRHPIFLGGLDSSSRVPANYTGSPVHPSIASTSGHPHLFTGRPRVDMLRPFLDSTTSVMPPSAEMTRFAQASSQLLPDLQRPYGDSTLAMMPATRL